MTAKLTLEPTLHVTDVDPTPIASLPYRTAMGQGRVDRVVLPLVRGQVMGLPAGVHGLVIASDLQGRTEDGQLLGIAVADWLVGLCEELGLAPDAVGVLLAGDLYTVPELDRRGGRGDVRGVWRAFADRFRWVAGVLGNHDDLGGQTLAEVSENGVSLLHATRVDLDGIGVAGVGGIIGDPAKPNRMDERAFLSAFEALWRAKASVLVSRESPAIPERGLIGNVALRGRVDRVGAGCRHRPLLICGHCHWPEPLTTLPSDVQVLNADGRVILLTM